jgi:hypothetical protein
VSLSVGPGLTFAAANAPVSSVLQSGALGGASLRVFVGRYEARDLAFSHHEVSPQLQLGAGCSPTAAQPFQRLPVTTAARTRVNAPQRAEEQSR